MNLQLESHDASSAPGVRQVGEAEAQAHTSTVASGPGDGEGDAGASGEFTLGRGEEAASAERRTFHSAVEAVKMANRVRATWI